MLNSENRVLCFMFNLSALTKFHILKVPLTAQGVMLHSRKSLLKLAVLLKEYTVKTRIKEQVFWGFRLILFLYIGGVFCKVSLKMFLNCFFKYNTVNV